MIRFPSPLSALSFSGGVKAADWRIRAVVMSECSQVNYCYETLSEELAKPGLCFSL